MKCSMHVNHLKMHGRWAEASIRSLELKPDDGLPGGDTVTLFLNDSELKEFADSIYAYLRKTAAEAHARAEVLVAGIPEEGSLEAIERAQDAALGAAEAEEVVR